MADQRLSSGQNADTNLNTVYQVPSGSVLRVYSFVLTNTTSNNISASIYINDGSADRLLRTLNIPQGSGNAVTVFEILGSYSGGDIVKIQAGSSDAFNYLLTGRLV